MTADGVSLDDLGWRQPFALAFQALGGARGLVPGRVVLQQRGRYAVLTDAGEVSAELENRFRKTAASAADLPCVGDWVALRFGYSLLGITNHPATAEATGLEVDKLDRRFVKKYMETYLDSYKHAVGPELMGKRGLRYVINDSWEAGSQNWTDNMIDQFRRHRGHCVVVVLPQRA